MSVEIIESYPSLREFKFILSMNYEQFRPYSLRWDNEQDRKDLFKRIHKMCDEVIRAKGTITRVYNHSLSTPSGLGGRLFGATSIQSVPREIRGLLMKHTTDIDMKNAHPVILRYICRKYQIDCPQLEYYINHRDEIIGKGPNRENIKNQYLRALNKDKVVPELKDFSTEIIKIQKRILDIPEFAQIHETMEGKHWNKSGSYLNKCLCIYENKILDCVRSYLYKNEYVIRCLAFDGLMIDGNHYDNINLLNHIEQEVENVFAGLNMKFDFKEHDNSIRIPSDFDENAKIERDDIEFAADDNEAANILIRRFDDILKGYGGRVFIKNNNLWVEGADAERTLFLKVLNSKIYKKNQKGEPIPYLQNNAPALNVCNIILKMCLQNKNDEEFYRKLKNSSIGVLCFNDGVLSFVENKFYTWECIPFECYTVLKINRDFKNYFENPNEKDISDVYEKVFVNLFGSDTEKAMHFFSRAISGNIKDKNWGTFIGKRDCGKGVLFALLANAFNQYVGSFNIGNFGYVRDRGFSQQDSKSLYHLLDIEWTRLAIAQELPDSKIDFKIRGELLKMVQSGGDIISARRNYDRRDTYFIPSTTLFIMGNHDVSCDSADCDKKRVSFAGAYSFASKEEIENKPESVRCFFREADPKIKTDYVNTIEWANATVILLLRAYKDYAVPIINEEDENPDYEKEDLSYIIAQNYNFKNKKAEIYIQDVYDKIAEAVPTYNKKQLNKTLEAFGVLKRKATKGSLHYGKYVFVGIEENELPTEEYADE